MDHIDKREIGRRVAIIHGMPASNHSLNRDLGERVLGIRRKNGSFLVEVKVVEKNPLLYIPGIEVWADCPRCHGEGEIPRRVLFFLKKKCKHCEGDGGGWYIPG